MPLIDPYRKKGNGNDSGSSSTSTTQVTSSSLHGYNNAVIDYSNAFKRYQEALKSGDYKTAGSALDYARSAIASELENEQYSDDAYKDYKRQLESMNRMLNVGMRDVVGYGATNALQSVYDNMSGTTVSYNPEQYKTDLDYYRGHKDELGAAIKQAGVDAAGVTGVQDYLGLLSTGVAPSAAKWATGIPDLETDNQKYLKQIYSDLEQEDIRTAANQQNMASMGYDENGNATVWSSDFMLNQNMIALDNAMKTGNYTAKTAERAASAVQEAERVYRETMANNGSSGVYQREANDPAYLSAMQAEQDAKTVLDRARYLYDNLYGASLEKQYGGVASAVNAGETDTYYTMVNGSYVKAGRGAASMGGAVAKQNETADIIGQMSDSQKATYNALYSQYGIEQANKYLDGIYRDLEKKYATDVRMPAIAKHMASASKVEAGAMDILSALATPAKVITGASDMVTKMTGGRVDTYDSAHMVNREQSAVRQGNSAKYGEAGQFIWDVLNSSLDSSINAAMFGGLASGLGAGSSAVADAVSFAMGTEVVGDTVIDLMDKGYSQDRAVGIGMIRGAIEWATEKWSIEQILSDSESVKKMLAKSFISEGSEEVASNILNNIVDIINDDPEGVYAAYQRMLEYGYSKDDALVAVIGSIAEEDIKSFLAGGLSGIGMSGVSMGIGATTQAIQESKAGKDILSQFNGDEQAARDYQQSLINAGVELGAEGAEKAKAKADSGKKLSNRQTYKLASATDAKLSSTVKEQLTSRGVSEREAEEMAGAITYGAITGEQSYANAITRGSEVAQTVMNELLSGNAEWVKAINAGVNVAKTTHSASRTGSASSMKATITADNGSETTGDIKALFVSDGKPMLSVDTGNGIQKVSAADVQLDNATAELVDYCSTLGKYSTIVFASYNQGQNVQEYIDSAKAIIGIAQNTSKSSTEVLSYLKSHSALTVGMTSAQVEQLYNRVVNIASENRKNSTIRISEGTGKVDTSGINTDKIYNKKNKKEYRSRAKQRAGIEFVKQLAEITGIDFELYESKANESGELTDAQGMYKDGRIRLDINAGMFKSDDFMRSAVTRTASHELTHWIKDAAPEAYSELQGFVLDMLAKERGVNLDALISNKMYREWNAKTQEGRILSYEDAVDELIADGCELMLGNSTAIRDLAREHYNTAERVGAHVVDFLRNLRDSFAGTESSSMESLFLRKYQRELSEKWDKALWQGVVNVKGNTATRDNAKTVRNAVSAIEDTALLTASVATDIAEEAKSDDTAGPESVDIMTAVVNAQQELTNIANLAQQGLISAEAATAAIDLAKNQVLSAAKDAALLHRETVPGKAGEVSIDKKSSNATLSGAASGAFENSKASTRKNVEGVNLVEYRGMLIAEDVAQLMAENGYNGPADWTDAQFSPRTIEAWGKSHVSKEIGGTKETVRILTELSERMLANDAIMGYVGNGEYTKSKMGPLRKNVEYHWTFDMDTSCPRTFEFINYRSQLQKLAGRPLTFAESINLLNLMKARGRLIPCTYCYVENKRIAKNAAYLDYFRFRDGVMSASTYDEAKTKMYSYNAEKGTVTEAAGKTLAQWRADVDAGVAFHPAATECWTACQQARNYVSNYLDGRLAEGKVRAGVDVKKKTGKSTLVKDVCKHFNITEAGAVKEVENFVAQWKYETDAGVKHNFDIENDGTIQKIDQRYLTVNRLATNYASSSSQARNVDNYEPYVDHLKNIKKEDKAYVMGMGGIRVHSSNDFRMDYVLDYLQFFADLAAGGWTSHLYTKSSDFVKVFGRSGARMNISIAMTTDAKTGEIVENFAEGMHWKEAQALQNAYKDVGTMAMVTDNAQLSFALNADWIQMIIPFHASGLPKAVWYNINLWNDYTSRQTEKYYNSTKMKDELSKVGVTLNKVVEGEETRFEAVKDGTVVGTYASVDDAFIDQCGIKTIYTSNGTRVRPHFMPNDTYVAGQLVPGHHNDAQRYFELCKEYGVHPRFYGMQVTDKTGAVVDVTEHENYVKLIKETARTDSVQEPVKFNFDQKDDFLGGMSPIDWAYKQLEINAKNGGYSNLLSGDPEGIVKEFSRDYLGQDKEIGWLSKKNQRIRDAIASYSHERVKADETAMRNLQELGEWKNSTRDSTGRELSEQQQAYFADSKVRDADGNLLVMYHGTDAEFYEFSRDKIGRHGAFEGTGFNFTPSSSRASGYSNGRVMEGYLNVTNPLSSDRVTMNVGQLAAIIQEIDPTGDDIIANYAANTRDYGTDTFLIRESRTTARALLAGNTNDVDIYSDLGSASGGSTAIIEAFEKRGYDGAIHYNEDGSIKTVIAFNSNQFKNSDNVSPTSDSDIRYSVRPDMTDEERYQELKNATVFAVTDKSDVSSTFLRKLQNIPKSAIRDAEKTVRDFLDGLDVLNTTLHAESIKGIEFKISKNNGAAESFFQQRKYTGSYYNFARALANLRGILSNSTLIQASTKDRYEGTSRADEKFEGVYVLAGAFQDEKSIVPVKCEIKKSYDKAGNLYVVVTMEEIKRTSVMGREYNNSEVSMSTLPATGSEYSLQYIVSKINPKDGRFLKSFPDKMLTEEQIASKNAALDDDRIKLERIKEKDRENGFIPKTNGTKNSTRQVINSEARAAAPKEFRDEDVRYSVRTEPAPHRTKDVYKLMRLKDGKLYALFIDSAAPIELGVWYNADSPSFDNLKDLDPGYHLIDLKTGEAITSTSKKPGKKDIIDSQNNGQRWMYIVASKNPSKQYAGEAKLYYNMGINGSGSVSEFALRPGWHAGSLPVMEQIGNSSNRNIRADNFVWVKGRIAHDIDYQAEAESNPSGENDIPLHLPKDGSYIKGTSNFVTKGMTWYISGAFIADEIISDREARRIVDDFNDNIKDADAENIGYDWPRAGGRVFDADTMSLVEGSPEEVEYWRRATASTKQKYIEGRGTERFSVRDKTQADIAELESEISSLENIRKGKISPKAEQDLFLAGEMRLSRQAGAEVRKLNDRISNLEKQLQQAQQLMKQSVADAELAGEIHVARQAAEEMGKKDSLLQQRKERIDRLQEELDSVRKKKNEKISSLIADRNEKLDELKQKMEGRFESYKESQQRAALIGQIKNIESQMTRRINNRAGKGAYIPVGLMQSCIDVVRLIDTSGEKMSGEKMHYESVKDALLSLRHEYDNLQTNRDSEYSSEYDRDMADAISTLADTVGRKPVREMTMSQLDDVRTLLQYINHVVSEAKEQIVNGKRVKNYDLAADAVSAVKAMSGTNGSEMRKLAKLGRDTKSHALNDVLSPLRNVKRLTGYKSNAFVDLFNELNNGVKKQNSFKMEASKMFDTLITGSNAKKYMDACNTPVTYTLKHRMYSGDTVDITMTPMQAMQLIMSWEREHVDGSVTNHLESGGIIIPNQELSKKGKHADAVAQGVRTGPITHFMILDLKRQIASADAWNKAFMDTADSFFNGAAKKAINDTSESLYGIRKAVGSKYIPFAVDRDGVVTDLEGVKYDASLTSKGMLKSLQAHASNALIMEGLNSVIDKHINEVAQLYGLAVPVRNFSKVYNCRMVGTETTLQSELRRTWNTDAVKMIENAISDLQTSRRSVEDTIAATLLRNAGSAFVKKSLLSSLSVFMKQAASYSTGGLYLSQKALAPYQLEIVKLLNNQSEHAKEVFAEIDAHTSEHWIRRSGLNTLDLKNGSFVSDVSQAIEEKVPNAINPVKWIQNMDVSTTAALWLACKKQVEIDGTSKSSPEYWSKVTELYEKVIEETQPMYDVLHRPEIQKSQLIKDTGVMMFKTQPLQNTGVIYDAFGELKAANSSTDKEWQSAAKAKFGKAVMSQVSSALVFSLMTAVSYGLKHKVTRYRDDDDELTVASFLNTYFSDVLSTVLGIVMPVGSDILFNFTTSKIKGKTYSYDYVTNPTVEMINSFVQTVDKFTESVGTDSFPKYAKQMAFQVAGLLGIPAENTYNLIYGGVKNIEDVAEGKFPAWNNDIDRANATNVSRMYKALVDGDINKYENVLAEITDSMVASGKRESDVDSYVSTQVSGKVHDAYVNGDLNDEEALDILQQLPNYKSKVAAQEKLDSWSIEHDTGIKYNDVKESYLSGDITREQAVDYKMQYGGKTRKEAEAEALEYDCKLETGYEFSDLKRYYTYGELPKDEAVSLLQQYGGVKADDAKERVQSWQCYVDTGVEYSDVHKSYLAGDTTDKQAIDMIVKYGGKTKEEAQEQVTSWKCEKETGISYEDLKEAVRGSEISDDKAKQYVMKYGGKDAKEADKAITKWHYQAECGDNTSGYNEAIQYYTIAKVAGLSAAQWNAVYSDLNSVKGTDKDGDGKADKDTKLYEMIAIIDALDISKEAKTEILKIYYKSKRSLRKAKWS